MQRIPLPVITKFSQSQCYIDNSSKSERKDSRVLEIDCCIHANSEDVKGDAKHCDRNSIDKKEQYTKALSNTCVEEGVSTSNASKTPLFDRMLLRPSVVYLPSFATGASGK